MTPQQKGSGPTPGRTVAELAAGLQRGDYDGTERFLAYSPERAAAPDLLAALLLMTGPRPTHDDFEIALAAIAKAQGGK